MQVLCKDFAKPWNPKIKLHFPPLSAVDPEVDISKSQQEKQSALLHTTGGNLENVVCDLGDVTHWMFLTDYRTNF